MSFGPPNVSQMLFQGIGGLGTMFQQGFDGAVKRQREQQRQGLLSELGASLGQENADFRSAAARALALGDADLGLGLLKLGETAAERRANQEALRNSPFSTGGGASGVSGASAGGDTYTGAPSGLFSSESGGRFNAQNDAVGAGGARGHFGRVQFGQARLQEAMNAGAIPQGTTPQQFMQSPELQRAAERWHFADIDNSIRQMGIDTSGRQTINGVPVTRDALVAVAHLGGTRGMQKFVETGGRYNPRDVNGTSLMDYFTRFARAGGQGGQQVAASPQRQTPGVQVAMTEEDVQRLEAQMPGYGGAPQPVQMAQGGQVAADVPMGAPAQFAAPGASQGRGGAMPPNDPRPDITDQQLMGVLANPRLQQQHAIAKTILDNRMRWRAEGGQLREEGQRLQNQKLQRELDNRFEPLTTPEARRAAGIPDEDKRPYQINRATNELKVVGGSQVTVNNRNEGAIPSGYRAVRDAQGNIERLEPIPGSKAEQEARDLAAKKAKADAMRGETGNTVANALDDIDRLSREAFFPVAGPVGSRLAQFSGTAAHDVKQAITTIAANISFDKLQQMREASPTGGALGAVTERELELLKNSAASLEQSQTPQQFRTNLGRVRAIFERTVHGRTLTPQERRIGGPMTPERAQSLRDEAQRAIDAGAPRGEVLRRLYQDFGLAPEKK